MDREKLLKHLEECYSSKRDMISRIPLGVQPDSLWQELLNLRRSSSTVLPLYGCNGKPYWYVTTNKMIASSEKIVSALFENETEFDPYAETPPVSTLEEVFFTGYIEGAQITMQEAMDFLTSGNPPRDIEEQLIINNRMAGSYASDNLYRMIDADYVRELAGILTDGMDNGSPDFRSTDETDYVSPNGEQFRFPPPQALPDLVNALCAFLADGNVHPLIKAAVAQAYMSVTRPFPEGNDRLGRILSSVILLRSGYTFFSELSLSALIARKGYAYYEATANILREENGNDLTYFTEYFLNLLSRAVDERKLRMQNHDEELRKSETEMARTVLSPPSQTGSPRTLIAPDDSGNECTAEASAEEDMKPPEITEEAIGDLEGFFTVSPEDTDNEGSLARVRDELYTIIEGDSTVLKNCAKMLLNLLEKGINTFTVTTIESACKLTPKQVSNLICHLKDRGLIESTDNYSNRHMVYRFSTKHPPLLPDDYSEDILKVINELRSSKYSRKEKDIGELILSCLPKGLIFESDYAMIGDPARMVKDMARPLKSGIVEKISNDIYRINREIKLTVPILTTKRKEILTELYLRFKDTSFTGKEVLASIGKSESTVLDALRTFELQNLLECKKMTKPYRYRLLVDPETYPSLFVENAGSIRVEATPKPANSEKIPVSQHDSKYSKEVYELIDTLATSEFSTRDRRLGTVMQQCMEKGTLLRSDYDDWGYTENMWSIDTELAVLLGLISKESSDCYSLNKELCPELRPTQKKTLTAIYEAFGCDKFSSDMFIATLNYSVSYTYASLHKLTLLRLLDQNIDENGNRYRLVVTPEENPECFDPAA